MQGSHAWRGDSAVFDDGNLVSPAGLVPLMELAEQAGLSRLLDEHVRFTSERVKSGAANSTPKLTSVIAGMAAGADSIEDLDVVRSGGMKSVDGPDGAVAVPAGGEPDPQRHSVRPASPYSGTSTLIVPSVPSTSPRTTRAATCRRRAPDGPSRPATNRR
jgi:hypothetical protein